MGEDASSFGFLGYKEAKERRDVLARIFSPKAVEESQGIVRDKVCSEAPESCTCLLKSSRS